MSSPSIAALLGRSGAPAERRRNPALAKLEEYSPSQGWATLAILLLTLLAVGESIDAADWVAKDKTIADADITATLIWSALVGLALAKTRAAWHAMIPAGLAIGALVVVWQSANVIVGDFSTLESFREMYARLETWWEAANSGGISADLLPFYMAMLAISWACGFFSSWFIFRRSNVWIAVVLLGTAVLTNLSFLPENYHLRFFIFVFLAMALVVRMSIIQRHERWRRLNVQFSPSASWVTLHVAVWFSVAVLALAMLLPMRVYTNSTIAQAWLVARTPIAATEEFFSRMFPNLATKKDLPGRLFSKWLPFIGGISFGGEPVAWAVTEYPSYWMSQSYNYYTSKGWIATDTERLEIGPDTLPPPQGDTLERYPKPQTMQLGFESDRFLSGGGFQWVSKEATIESLLPRKFYIHVEDDSGDATFPEDIREVAGLIRSGVYGMSAGGAERLVSELIPDSVLVHEIIEDDDGNTEWVTLQRKAGASPDLVSWKFDANIRKNEVYSMVSLVSEATDDDLRQAPTEYDYSISDHYLQLPPSLPDRVRELAERLTANADNPLDKALAIQDYLRGHEFTYSLGIEAPPTGQDGVDWFLFDTKEGYSDYFSSAMAVMLRAVGVPARIAAGYAPGELNADGHRVIRDSDSHGWVQAYFPNYGWIDFEPTPNWPEHDRLIPTAAGGGADDALGSGAGGAGGDLDEDPLLEEGFGGPAAFLPARATRTNSYARYVTPALIALAVVAAIWFVGWLAWNAGLRSLRHEERLYAKLTRLGWLAGAGRRAQQTPLEYGAHIASVVPSAGEGAMKIAYGFAASRYGPAAPDDAPTEADEEAGEELSDAWKSIRFDLLGRVFGRLIPQSRQRQSAE